MSNYSTTSDAMQEAVISDDGELICLHDMHYRWVDKRRDCIRLGKIFVHLGWREQADKARLCGTVLQYYRDSGGHRSLMGANFCKQRLCPMCIGRRARKMAWRLGRIMDKVEARDGLRYIFLTLTIRNCSGDELRDTIGDLLTAWDRMLRRRPVRRAVKGWFRAVEITRNWRDGSYHPHIHAILAVGDNYWADDYLSHGDYVDMWRQSLGVGYDPSVRIQVVKGKGLKDGSAAAAKEAAKYAVKPSEYVRSDLDLDTAASVVETYTAALRRRRMVGMGGVIREAALELDGVVDESMEDDLVHADEERIREDLAVMVETYKWSFGVGDYVLIREEQLHPETGEEVSDLP